MVQNKTDVALRNKNCKESQAKSSLIPVDFKIASRSRSNKMFHNILNDRAKVIN